MGSLVWAITNRAAAWLTTEAAVAARGSRRSTTRPRQRRPITAMVVVTATATAASERPIVGSRIAIWCTMKPTWAIRASAKGADTVQNPRLRRSSQRERPVDSDCGGRGPDPGDLLAGRWIRN